MKAALHLHTKYSYDGKWSLEQLKSTFSRFGYSVLFMSEHDQGLTQEQFNRFKRHCRELSDPNCIIIPGIEYSDVENRVHILCYGKVPFLGEGLPTMKILQSIQAYGGIAIMAHPSRRDAWQCFNKAYVPYLNGIEIWNRKVDGFKPSQRAREILKCHPSLWPYVSHDFHVGKQLFPFYMKLKLKNPFCEYQAIDALRKNQCWPRLFGLSVDYLSSGISFQLLQLLDRLRKCLLKYYDAYLK